MVCLWKAMTQSLFLASLLNMSLMGKFIYLVQCSQYFSHFSTGRKWSDYLWPSEGKQEWGCWQCKLLVQAWATRASSSAPPTCALFGKLWCNWHWALTQPQFEAPQMQSSIRQGQDLLCSLCLPQRHSLDETWFTFALQLRLTLQQQLFSQKGALWTNLCQSSFWRSPFLHMEYCYFKFISKHRSSHSRRPDLLI